MEFTEAVIHKICDIIQTICIVIITYFLIGFMISAIDRAKWEMDQDMGGKITETRSLK